MLKKSKAVVAPVHSPCEKEGWNAKDPTLVGLARSATKQLVRCRVIEHPVEVIPREARLLCQGKADLSVDWPRFGTVGGRAQGPSIGSSRAKQLACGSRTREKIKVKFVVWRLAERDAIVLRPHLRVAFAVQPIVLPRNGLSLKGVLSAQRSDFRTPHWTPVELAADIGFDSRDLASSKIRVPATGREEELDNPFCLQFAPPNL